MACGTTCTKYLVFIFNLLFFVAGILLIVVGSLTLTHKVDYQDVVKDASYNSAIPILFIVVGCIVAVIAFFGCCGAIQESVCMLNTFAFFLILIILAEIAIAIAAFVFRNQVKDEIKKEMFNTLRVAYDTSGNATLVNITDAWDKMQMGFMCCGVDNPSDWNTNNSKQFPGIKLPQSCCSTNSSSTVTPSPITAPCTTQSPNLHKKGCFSDMEWGVNALYIALGAIGLVVGFIEILGVVLACCLSKAVK